MVSAFLLMGLLACNRNSSGGDVMASVNGRKIYRSEVDKYYANQTAGSDQQPVGEQAISLRLTCQSDPELELWGGRQKTAMFEEVFGLRCSLAARVVAAGA